MGESWTVETWLSLSSLAKQNPEQNPEQYTEQKLQASEPQPDARFGNSVAVSDNTAIVGAYQEDSKAGAAYIFEFDSNGTWSLKQKLQARDSSTGDLFGRSVAISGNFAIVGADDEDTGGKSAGAAYIFERDSNGNWSEKAKIQASDKQAFDNFGYSLGISDNVALVGAYGQDTGGSSAGAAYIFERDSNGNWSEKAKIQASDKQASDNFGSNVAISSNIAIVGAWKEDTGGSNAGAAYIFERDDSNGTWSETKQLFASDAEADDRFGRSVAISGNIAIVGADNEGTGGKSTGAVYIFERDNSGTWTEKIKLQANDKQQWDNFGYSVAISENIALVGAYGQDAEGSNAGAAYIFERDNNGTWSETKKLIASDAEADDNFGNAVAIGENFAVVGSPKEDTGVSNAGSAYIFKYQPTTQILVGSKDSDSPVVIQDQSQLGTVVDGVFYDSGYNLEQLTPGWHHITAVAQDTTTTFYLDGQKIGDVKQALIDAAPDDASRQQLSAKIYKTTGNISTIGNNTSNTGELGKLAEVRVWNRSLSESEIAENSSKVRLAGNESGLSAYYPLNEAQGTEVIDRTDNNNNGTIADAAWWCGTVPIENLDHQVMQFDGVDDYIDLGEGVVVGANFTEEAWIYSTITDDGYHGFLGQNASKRAPSLWICQRNRIHGDFGFDQGGRLGILTSRVMFADTWNHIAATYDGVDYKVYVNGEECFSKSLSDEPVSSTPIKHIGKVDNYFQGQIAEVRIWNKTRTTEEIRADMHQRLTGSESGLVAYLPLNEIQTEGDTQKVLDLTSNSVHGNIHGATLESSDTLPIV